MRQTFALEGLLSSPRTHVPHSSSAGTGGAACTCLAVAALTVAGWHIGPATTWLPPVRSALSPALDGRGDPRRVALTFDDGPDPDSTPLFLHAGSWRAALGALPELVAVCRTRGLTVGRLADHGLARPGILPGDPTAVFRRPALS